jgi:myo-inositol catabolism protein IolS
METRRLGRTGLTIGVAGFHASWRQVDSIAGRDALRYALERGVDLVVCDPFHERVIESIVGEVVKELRARDRAIVTTRATTIHPKAMQPQVEQSLRATRLEAIPLVLLDWDDRAFYDPTWLETRYALERLVRAGKVLRWGLTPRPGLPVDEIRLGVSESILEVVAIPYNLLARTGMDAVLDSAKRHDAGVIAMQPLHAGLLGGGWNRKTIFGPTDWRAEKWPPAKIVEALAPVAKLAPLATQETDSLAELALRVVVQHEAFACVAPSMHTRAQVDVALRIGDGRRLGAPLLQRIDEALS